MRKFSSVLLMSVGLVAWGQPGEHRAAAAPQGGEQRVAPESIEAGTAHLNEWFAARWKEQLDFSPIQKTFLGQKDDYARIDDFSERAERAQLAWRRRTTAEMKKTFDYERLTPEAKISYDIWSYELERAERGVPFRRRAYVFTQMQGPQASLPQFLIAFHKVDDASDMEAYIARIGGISRAIGQLLERARLVAGEGVRPPRFAYEGVIAQARAVITGAPFGGEGEAPLWADANAKIDALRKAGKIDDVRARLLRAAARRALLDKFKPSYAALIAWFEQDVKRADVEARGVGKLPQGLDFYAER
ncbi:MAG: DUF885 family protein, partial [Acidobacteria bacterium]|nr:DUF885 family protein [Acidobacteriota bacterium]